MWGISEIEGDVLRGDLEVLADKVSVGGFGLAEYSGSFEYLGGLPL